MKKVLIVIVVILVWLFGTKYIIWKTYMDYKNPNINKIDNIQKSENNKVLLRERKNKLREKKEFNKWKENNKSKINNKNNNSNEKEKNIETKKEINKVITQEDINKESQKIKDKILTSRDTYAEKWLIQEWDTYLENKQLILALMSYKKVIKNNPWNIEVIKKIWDTYFEMNKYEVASKYYKDLIWTPQNNQDKTTLNYIYSIDFSKNINISTVFTEIDNLKLSPENNFFYKSSVECILDRKLCLDKFEKHIKQGKWKNDLKIHYIKKWLENHENLQTKKEYFKHTQFLAALFQSKLYPISNILWEKILEKQPWYLPVLKIVAKWYYELWDYKKAKEYLKKYNKIDDEDVNVNYMLWIINIKLHEYILSNIYFNKALKLWYRPRANVSRRLIYNYYLIEDNKRMMQEFEILINKINNINETDYSLAIYYSLINWKNIQANKWINNALKLYPKNDNFYWYKWWVYKEAQDFNNAERYLLKWYELNKHNPLINLNLWIVNMKKDNLLKAKIYFKNTIKEDSNWDFWKLASEHLARIKLEQQKIEDSIQENVGNIN